MSARRDYTAVRASSAVSRGIRRRLAGCGEPRRPEPFWRWQRAVIVEQWDDFTVDASGKVCVDQRKALRVLNRRSADRYLTAAGFENNDTVVLQSRLVHISSGRVMQWAERCGDPGSLRFELVSDSRAKVLRAQSEEGSWWN